MPLALMQTDDIKFMIAVGCPGMSGIEQTAYLIRKQLIFEEISEEEAQQCELHFKKILIAQVNCS